MWMSIGIGTVYHISRLLWSRRSGFYNAVKNCYRDFLPIKPERACGDNEAVGDELEIMNKTNNDFDNEEEKEGTTVFG